MSMNMTDKEYRSLELVSYSSLSNLADSPQNYKAEQSRGDFQTPAMILGSVVDMLLTDKKRFDEEVYVMTADKPGSPMMLKYAEVFAETGNSTTAHANSGFKIGAEAAHTKFTKDGKAYYDALIAGQGKMIIGAEDMFTANQLVRQLTSNLFTKKYFTEDRSPDTELRFQVSILWNIQYTPVEGGDPRIMKVKSMLDVIHIDHANKVITPIDLKTGGEGFMKSYWKYKRYLQASMYTDALLFVDWGDREILHDYKIMPLKFVFADTNLRNAPMIHASTELDIRAGREGISYLEPIGGKVAGQGVDSVAWGPMGQTKRKGYIQLIAELDWHQRNDQWDYSYEDFQNRGEKQINAFGIKL